MITQKDKMLMLVLKDPQLQASYGYDAADYESLSEALDSSNPVVATPKTRGNRNESIKSFSIILITICWYDYQKYYAGKLP